MPCLLSQFVHSSQFPRFRFFFPFSPPVGVPLARFALAPALACAPSPPSPEAPSTAAGATGTTSGTDLLGNPTAAAGATTTGAGARAGPGDEGAPLGDMGAVLRAALLLSKPGGLARRLRCVREARQVPKSFDTRRCVRYAAADGAAP